MKISLILFCTLLLSNLLGQQDCILISQKGDFCFESSDFIGYSAKFNEKSSLGWLRHPKSKRTIELNLPDTLPPTVYYRNLIRTKIIKKPTTLLFIQTALTSWYKIKLTLNYNYTDSGLGIKIIKTSQGKRVQAGQFVQVHYTGMFEDGRIFDSSKARSNPFTFKVGEGQVIKGWDEGLTKLHVGDIVLLKIPPDLGYGSQERGIIPANSTLYFEIEVLSIE